MNDRTHSLLSYVLVVLYIGLIVFLSFTAQDRSQLLLLFGLSLAATALVVLIHKYGRLNLPVIIGVAILLRILFIPLEPSLSDDAYRYIWDGAVCAEGTNPYLYKPSDQELVTFQSDPIYEQLNSSAFYTVYPPVSQLYFLLGGQFYDANWIGSYYAIKILLVLSEILVLVLLAQMVSPLFVLLYAWHPLVLIETAGQAHTESAMLLFLLLCIWFAKKDKGGYASVALAFAGMIKLYPFVLFPLLWRRFRWKGLIPGGVAALLLFIPFYHPAFFSNIKSSLDLYVSYFEFNAGVYYGVKEVFLWWTGDDWSKQLGPFFRMIFLLGLPVIYALDYWKSWTLEKAFLVIIGFFLLASTTIHPWYFLGVLMLIALLEKTPWHWYWVASISLGTYMLYVDGPYWPVVIAGWVGWLVLGLYFHRGMPKAELRSLQRLRSNKKVEHISAFLPDIACGLKVLDLGAGEGYVGEAAAEKWSADVKLADVCDMNETHLPHTVYDGKTLPFAPNSFDVTILYFVLHHCEDPETVLQEAMRVTKGKLVIVESVYEEDWDLKLLTFLDVLANRLRSGGLMNYQEEYLGFKRAPAWKKLIQDLGGRVVAEHRKGEWIHKQHTFVVQVA
ncbi:MAG: methyltransferase domain-containing protein [Rhodothermales bacterium]